MASSRPRPASARRCARRWRRGSESVVTMLKLPARYEPLAVLGEGAFGVVYKVRDHEQGGLVALKWLKRVDPAGVQGFKREFRELCDLRHTNLVALYELEQAGEQWWF